MAKASKWPTPASLKAAFTAWSKGDVTIGQVRRTSGIRGTILVGAFTILGTTPQNNAIQAKGKRAQSPTGTTTKTAKTKVAKTATPKATKATVPAPEPEVEATVPAPEPEVEQEELDENEDEE